MQRAKQSERLPVQRGRTIGNESAGALARFQPPHGNQRTESHSQGGPADAELISQFALWRQAVSRPELVSFDQLVDLIHNTVARLPGPGRSEPRCIRIGHPILLSGPAYTTNRSPCQAQKRRTLELIAQER